MSRVRSFGAFLLCVFAVCAPSAWSQGQGSGSIEGVVKDTSGAVIPGVTVEIRNLGTNATRTAITDDRGYYRADFLPSGEYEISASQTDFTTARIERLNLVVGTSSRGDLTLQVAGAQATVAVFDVAPLIQPDKTEITNIVGEREVQDLPINGRRWENFVLLTPGVSNDGNFGLVTYRGISGLYNNNSIDGADNNQAFFSEARGRTRVSYTYSQSSVKEFQVGLSNFSAEFGRAAGGTVNAVTKSGTNEFHGEGFYFIRDKSLIAQDPRAKALGQAQPDERRQQFGVSAGGPVVKDKLFFFGTYDQQKRTFPGFTFPNVPFASVPCTAQGCASTIAFLDGLTGQFPRRGDNYVFLTKADWVINQNHTLTGSYNFQKWNSPNGIQTQQIITVSQLANGSDRVRTDMINEKLSSVLGAKAVNEFRFQWGRDFESQVPNSPGPSVSFTNGISFGQPNFLPRPAFPDEKRLQWADNYSFIGGNHSFKVGVDINYVRELQINLFNGGGVFSYTSLNDLALDCASQASGCVQANTGANTGKHFSNFQQAFDLRGQQGRIFFTTTDWNAYFQDTWRIRPTLTLYGGIRYEFTDLPDPKGNPAFPLTTRFNRDTNNWGPRFSFAWDIGGVHKTVVRGGYGLYYGRTSNSAIANGLINNGLTVQNFFFTPTSPGAPTFPNVLSVPPAGATGTATINFFSDNFVRPLIHSTDLVIEQQLPGGIAISGSYLFSRGQRLPQFRDINLPAPSGTATFLLPNGTPAGTFPLFLGTRPNPAAGQLIISESVLNSFYHAFVLVVSKNFGHGIQFSSNFTVSKALDNGQNSQTFFGGNNPFDSQNRQNDKGLSTFDLRKRSVTDFIVAPSVNRFTGNRAIRGLMNDWQFSGILTFEDGRPITGTINGSLPSLAGSTNSSSLNGSGGSQRVPFLAPNSFTGTGRSTVDFRTTRTIRITAERMKAQVIAEAFNIFNRVNFTSFQTTQFSIGTVTRTGNDIVVPLREPTGLPFLTPLNTSNTLFGAREFQLAVKFLW